MISVGPSMRASPGETWVPRQDQVPLLARFAADYPEPQRGAPHTRSASPGSASCQMAWHRRWNKKTRSAESAVIVDFVDPLIALGTASRSVARQGSMNLGYAARTILWANCAKRHHHAAARCQGWLVSEKEQQLKRA
jgi:hypothetical protein